MSSVSGRTHTTPALRWHVKDEHVRDGHVDDLAQDMAQDVAEDELGAAEGGSVKVIIVVRAIFMRRNPGAAKDGCR